MKFISHTKGPFKIVGPHVATASGKVVAKMSSKRGGESWASPPASVETLANARLFAGAPDTLAASLAALTLLRDRDAGHSETDRVTRLLEQSVAASIAGGESPDLVAHTRLLGAAPALLAALEKAAWFIENVSDDMPGDERSELFFETREAWRNAYAQVNGEGA